MIVSASRRTDIPAYYSEWFVNRLRSGFVYVRNPFNLRQVSNIPLSPNLVDCIVFWTKDARPMVEKLPVIEGMGYKHYLFLYTITPYDKTIEVNAADKELILNSFIALSEKTGKNRVIWRYDPIFLFEEKFDISFHAEAFEKYCRRLHKYCERVIISFIDIYKHIRNSFERTSGDDIASLTMKIRDVCLKYGLSVQSCCENDPDKYGIKQGACIDRDIISGICKDALQLGKDSNQRKNCLCHESIDIGAYNTCLNGCTYCYANKGESLSEYYDETSPLLCSFLTGEDKLYNREVKTHRNKLDL